MPIILEDSQASANSAQSTSVAAAVKTMSPKDYNTILSGNGVNQGLLKNIVTVNGTDQIPAYVKQILQSHKRDCTNKTYRVHDDVHSYTVLHQDISLCGGYANYTNRSGVRTAAAPSALFTDHFMTLENAKSGMTKTFRSRLFLRTIYVYKAVNNYVLGNYILMAVNDTNPTEFYVTSYDSLYNNNFGKTGAKSPCEELYTSLAEKVIANHKNWMVKVNDATALASADSQTSMYDLIMNELAIIKTPGVLLKTLEALSASGFDTLSYANNILNLINLPFMLYQTDVISVINSRTPDEAKNLKNANMSLSLADTLNAMAANTNATIPELVGKTYTTTKTKLTTEQKQAIESPYRMTVVAAGAGTGKSTCIQHRLAFMEENNCNMKNTIVLSFTKAAAGHIKKNFKECKSSTIAEFTHSFVNVILDNGSGERVDIVAHSDFVQKLKIRTDDLVNANILKASTITALQEFITCCENIEVYQYRLLDMLDTTLNPEAANLISILKMIHCTSLELDPIIFHTQLSILTPNIEHIVVDESQDSNRLEFLTMLKMSMQHDISIYIVGDCAQTLYEFRDADPRILNNLTKLFTTYDLSINHRSTQIILDVANLMSNTMSTHKTILKSNNMMQITKAAIDATITMNTYDKVKDPKTMKILDDYLEKHLGKNESIAILARSNKDVDDIYEYIHMRYGAKYTVVNITSQRRNDIKILSEIGENIPTFLPAHLNNWQEFEQAIKDENLRLNSRRPSNSKFTKNGPVVNKVTLDWLTETQADAANIIQKLNDINTRPAEIRKLQLSLLDMQTEKNNTLQRVMDAKNSKLKESKADIIISSVHGVKGLEYDHVACFINTETGRNGYTSSDENKRIAYVALTRAKQTECVFCTREKLLKDFLEYYKNQP